MQQVRGICSGLAIPSGRCPSPMGAPGRRPSKARGMLWGLEIRQEQYLLQTVGRGQTTVSGARNALGLGNTSGAVPIANGGTGQTSVEAARYAMGLGWTNGGSADLKRWYRSGRRRDGDREFGVRLKHGHLLGYATGCREREALAKAGLVTEVIGWLRLHIRRPCLRVGTVPLTTTSRTEQPRALRQRTGTSSASSTSGRWTLQTRRLPGSRL